MLISVAVISGFKSEIKTKLTGFSGHIVITNYDDNLSLETKPIEISDSLLTDLQEIDGVEHIQFYATKSGIIKTADKIQGAALKGISTDFDGRFLSSRLVEGELFQVNDTATTNQVLISQRMANILQLKTGDAFEMYFIQDPPRVRKFTISGLFDTQIDDIDKTFIVCDIKHIQRLSGWTKRQISGAEIFIDDFSRVDSLAEKVDDVLAYYIGADGSRLRASSIREKFPNLFDWLDLLNMNVWIILSLMIVVAGFNMISGLLILLIEKTSVIGLLKALGMRNENVRMIFIYRAAFIVLKGMLWGNIIGIGICALQACFGIIKLDPVNYFLDTVPVQITWWHIIAVNALTFVCITLLLTLPALIITRISPEKTLKVE